ncbi:uncharacterized protein PG998_003857 [Apiospora kogelbergensis]|uniref:Uncharacterized protein n=1 Tax=Apiospora kogelbergensis TaxID=1337665 RepID=A0AAW0QJM0_9PEZI
MSFGPQIAMSGAFHFEAPNGASPVSGVHAGVFRPPMSPSASSSVFLTKSTGSLMSDASTPATYVNRKRQRPGEATPTQNGMTNGGNIGNSNMGPRRISGGREIRYTLGGQIETPNGMVQKQLGGGDMESSTYSDIDYRRALGSNHPHDEFESPPSGQNRTDLPREPQETQANGWSNFAFNAIGGVVGKVWEFCKTGAFRGFYGGGGRGFDAHANPVPGSEQPSYQTSAAYDHGAAPGGFPDSDYAPFYYEHDTPDTTPPPAAKRRQISAGMPNDELRKNWVMVNEPAETPAPPAILSRPTLQSRPSLPRRISKPVSRLSTTPSFQRRHSGRISHAGSSSINYREPASFASPFSSPRTSLSLSMAAPERPSTPSRLPVAVRQPQSPALFSPSPRQSRIPSPSPHVQRGHRRNHSAASAASVGSAATAATGKVVAPVSSGRRRETLVEGNSPRLDPEAQHMVARRMREERAADARINDFNARLQEMIRQGKEALGTTIEVDGGMGYGGGATSDHWEDEY